jgi:hypothetical protein
LIRVKIPNGIIENVFLKARVNEKEIEKPKLR